MFDSLSDRLSSVFDRLRGRGALNEADVRGAMREVRPLNATAERVARIHAETEKWCARAAAMGQGYRLFRSDPRLESDVTGHRAIVDFQILEPGQGAPASGTIFGPWPGSSSHLRERSMWTAGTSRACPATSARWGWCSRTTPCSPA